MISNCNVCVLIVLFWSVIKIIKRKKRRRKKHKNKTKNKADDLSFPAMSGTCLMSF